MQHSILTPIILLVLVATGSAGEEDHGPAALLLDPLVEDVFRIDLTPGLAVAVVHDGEIIYLRGMGQADREAARAVTPDTVFYIASTTKSFLGTAAAILARRGELDLDAPLGQGFERARFHPDVDPSTIALRDLFTHTHGIENSGPVTFRLAYSGEHDAELLLRLLAYHGPARSGREFDYGNIGFNLAGLVLEARLGIGWKELLARELFEPLGMTSTTAYISRIDAERLAWPYRVHPEGFERTHFAKGDANMHSAGGLVTSARDMARWLEVQTCAGRLDGKAVLPAAAIGDAQWPTASMSRSEGPFQFTGYGLGWMTGEFLGETLVSHPGGFTGFNCHVSLLPERHLGVVVLSNTSESIPVVTLVAAACLGLVLELPETETWIDDTFEILEFQATRLRKAQAEDLARRAERNAELAHPLADFAGRYASDRLGHVEFDVREGRLEARMGRLWSAVEVFDAARDQLRVELTGTGSVASFVFPEDGGPAAALELDGETFVRVAAPR